MTKGKRAEREAARLYEDAGFETYRPPRARGGPTDVFGHFDLLAFTGGGLRLVRVTRNESEHHPDHPLQISVSLQLVQVKCNVARGIEEFCADTFPFSATGGLCPTMLVRHDGQGGHDPTPPRWRVLVPAGENSHYTVVDERETGTSADGDGVRDWLREERRTEVSA